MPAGSSGLAGGSESRPRPSVFLSYSGRARGDKALALELLWRLEGLGIKTWKYEAQGEISLGEPIWETCAREIEQADLFVLLLTRSALDSRWVRQELAHAEALLSRHSRPAIVTVSSSHVSQMATWPEPFGGLRSRKCWMLDSSPDAVEALLTELTLRLGVRYVPPPSLNARLPLREHLVAELMDRQPARPEEYRIVRMFLGTIRKCEEAYRLRNLSKARSLVETLVEQVESEYSGPPLYYPRLANLVFDVEFTLTALDADQVEVAVRVERLHTLLEKARAMATEPTADENAWGLVGWIEYALDQPHRALAAYERALELAPDDGDILFNLVWIAQASGVDYPVAPLLRRLDGLATSSPLGPSAQELALLEWLIPSVRLPKRAPPPPEGSDQIARLAELVDVLFERAVRTRDDSPLRAARAFLARLPEDLRDDPRLCLRLARVLHAIGDFRGAEAQYERFELVSRAGATDPTRSRIRVQARAELALTVSRSGGEGRARLIALDALASLVPSDASRDEGFEVFAYYRGLLAHLAGDEAHARDYFRDSGRPPEQWYGELRPIQVR